MKKRKILTLTLTTFLVIATIFLLKEKLVLESGAPTLPAMRDKALTRCDGNQITVFDQSAYYGKRLYFCTGTVHKMDLLQKCPDAWGIDEMPVVNGDGKSRETILINGKKVTPSELDKEWIKINCKVNTPTIVS